MRYSYYQKLNSRQRVLEFFIAMNKTARISWQSPECSDCPLIHIEYFLGKENFETYNFWTISELETLSRTQLK